MKRWLRSSRFSLSNGKTNPEVGYTITEVMIVLAVSAALFATVVAAFSGRQAKVEFTKAVRDYEAFLQNTMSDVQNGYYQSIGECTVDDAGSPSVTQNESANTGTSGQCTFLGKALAAGYRGDDSTTSVFTIIGRRFIPVYEATGSNPTSNCQSQDLFVFSWFCSRPVLSTDPDPHGGWSDPEEADPEHVYSHSFGLRVVSMKKLDSDEGTLLGGIGFIYNISNSNVVNQSSARLYSIAYDDIDPAVGVQIDDMIPTSEGIVLCLEGQNGQNAEIRLGSSAGHTTITSVLDTNASDRGPCYE